MRYKEKENWKHFGPHYRVSSTGKVESLLREGTRGGILTQHLSGGYPTLNLSLNGKIRAYRVHRLVAEIFLPNPQNKAQVNHLSGDKEDNRVENLAWATPSENMLHAMRTGLNKTGSARSYAKLSEKIVQRLRERFKGVYGELSRTAKLYGVAPQTLAEALNGTTWKIQ